MSEIPLTGSGDSTSTKPKEVIWASWLILIEAIAGLIVVGIEFGFGYDNDYTLLGLVLVVIAFILYPMILKQDYSAWMLVVIFNVFAIFLYLVGENYPGAILSVLVLVYLISPNVRVHFEQNR